jgi:hypothetical protein
MTRNNKFKANNTTTKAPVATSKTVRIGKPKITSKSGNTLVSHREYVGQVNSNTTTSIESFRINPGLSFFSWLQTVATGFEEYRFRSLKFSYVSAAATSERGRVSLAYQFDPTADNPVSRAGLFAIVPNVEEAPWEDMELRVPMSAEYKFVRSGAIPGSYNTYDAGKLHVLTSMNADSTTQLGELFVEYVVELKQPQFQQMPGGELTAVAPTKDAVFGTSITVNSGQPLVSYKSSTQIQINTTRPMMITFYLVGTGLVLPNPTYGQKTGSNGTISVKTNHVSAAGTGASITVTTKYSQQGDHVTVTAAGSVAVTSMTVFQAVYVEQ